MVIGFGNTRKKNLRVCRKQLHWATWRAHSFNYRWLSYGIQFVISIPYEENAKIFQRRADMNLVSTLQRPWPPCSENIRSSSRPCPICIHTFFPHRSIVSLCLFVEQMFQVLGLDPPLPSAMVFPQLPVWVGLGRGLQMLYGEYIINYYYIYYYMLYECITFRYIQCIQTKWYIGAIW